MSNYVELSSATGYEAFGITKTGEFANGSSIFIELGIVMWVKSPNFQTMILTNDYDYETSVLLKIDHFFLCALKNGVSCVIDGVEVEAIDRRPLDADNLKWDSLVFSLQNTAINKKCVITAKRTSDILIIGRSEVFVEISLSSTKVESIHRMVCNLKYFACFLDSMSELLFSS